VNVSLKNISSWRQTTDPIANQKNNDVLDYDVKFNFYSFSNHQHDQLHLQFQNFCLRLAKHFFSLALEIPISAVKMSIPTLHLFYSIFWGLFNLCIGTSKPKINGNPNGQPKLTCSKKRQER